MHIRQLHSRWEHGEVFSAVGTCDVTVEGSYTEPGFETASDHGKAAVVNDLFQVVHPTTPVVVVVRWNMHQHMGLVLVSPDTFRGKLN